MGKKGIPDRWLPASPVGKPVPGTRFLPFKVPLKMALCYNLQPNDRFSPDMLLQMEPNLRLVIDLTNTQRYYNKNDFIYNGVSHEKIFCPGKMVPPRYLVNKFFNIVDKFMKSADTEDKYIGVHCTHGINRTGYFICAYMIEKLGFTPDEAIAAFQEARGHNIERDYFLEELYKPVDQTEPTGKSSLAEYHKRKNTRATKKYVNRHQKNTKHHPRQMNNKPGYYPAHSGRKQGPLRDAYYRCSQLNYYEDDMNYNQRNTQWKTQHRNRYTYRANKNYH